MRIGKEFTTPQVLGEHGFPAIWRYILPEDAHWLKWPSERQATCSTCPKVAQGVHHKSTRCCTYFPEIPNFLLGFALQDSASKPLIEKQIARGHILPTGQQIDAWQYRKAVASYADNLFGELTELVCPFLDPITVQCGVYAYRNSVCSTFYCENDHGESGHKFWEKAQDLVGHIEIALAQAAMEALGFDVAGYMALLDGWASNVHGSFIEQGGWSAELREELWGPWYGRESQFLIAAADWVVEHKDTLYDLACEQSLFEARGFEAAVRKWLPEKIRPHASQVNSDLEGSVPSPVSEFWYQVQLMTRQLWELPFGEGRWLLNSEAVLRRTDPNLVQLSGAGGQAPKLVVEVSQQEEELLLIFQEPQVFNEVLMGRQEFQAVEGHREFLAECLRRGVLVAHDSG